MPTRERAARQRTAKPQDRKLGAAVKELTSPRPDRYDRAAEVLIKEADEHDAQRLKQIIREALSEGGYPTMRDVRPAPPLTHRPPGNAQALEPAAAAKPTVLSRINSLEVNLAAIGQQMQEFAAVVNERLARLEAEVGL